jgi:pimeloyl-ACP methyl ester carboxylesterase
MPERFIESVWAGRTPGTWPEMLELYRSADPDRLAAAGQDLDRLDCPALVVWGQDDLYLPAEFGRAYADRLPNAELVALDRAGHYPWLDRPDAIGRIVGFLTSTSRGGR